MSDIRYAAIVPFRGDSDGVRSRNANVVLAQLISADCEVVLVEHAAEPDPSISLPEGAKRVTLSTSGPFNKALACNVGVMSVDADVIALVDADTLVRPAVLRQVADRIAQRDEVVRPFGSLVELDQAESERVLQTGELPADQAGEPSDDRAGEFIPATGGIVVLQKQRYLSVGGMDESFRGWGGEDNAFEWALRRSHATLRVLSAEPAWHLWHPRPVSERYGHADYPDNRERAIWWRECDDASFQNAVEAGRTILAAHLQRVSTD